jgi:tripartite-type tricarboxylate transporter receptor subunit TctC
MRDRSPANLGGAPAAFQRRAGANDCAAASREGFMDRRRFVAGSAATAVALATRSAQAQEVYPSRPITIINPFPPGGAADVVARPFAAILEPQLKQAVVIETKAGAAGQVGAQFAASAKPDGYTLLVHIVSISGFAEVDRLYGRPVKFTRDDVNDKQPYKTLEDFIDDVKKRPNELVFSSSGMHGALHLPTALFMKAAGIQMRHLPTQGGGPAVTALLGNNSQVQASAIAAILSQIKAGKARALAVFGAQRSAALPDVPTLKESGYDIEFYLWVGLFAPKGTPDAIVTKLRDETRKAAATDQFKGAMTNLGQEVAYLDQAEFKAFWDADAKRVEEAVRAVGKVDG